MKNFVTNSIKSSIFTCVTLFIALSSIGQGKSDSLVNANNKELKTIISTYGETLNKTAYVDSVDRLFIKRAKNNPYKLLHLRDSLASELHKESELKFIGWMHYKLGDIIKNNPKSMPQIIELTLRHYENDTAKVLGLYPELKPYIKH